MESNNRVQWLEQENVKCDHDKNNIPIKIEKRVINNDNKLDVFIAVGNEGKGISLALKSLPHQKVSIPMPGKIESLNAALAGGIIIYEWAKNRYNL